MSKRLSLQTSKGAIEREDSAEVEGIRGGKSREFFVDKDGDGSWGITDQDSRRRSFSVCFSCSRGLEGGVFGEAEPSYGKEGGKGC